MFSISHNFSMWNTSYFKKPFFLSNCCITDYLAKVNIRRGISKPAKIYIRSGISHQYTYEAPTRALYSHKGYLSFSRGVGWLLHRTVALILVPMVGWVAVRISQSTCCYKRPESMDSSIFGHKCWVHAYPRLRILPRSQQHHAKKASVSQKSFKN